MQNEPNFMNQYRIWVIDDGTLKEDPAGCAKESGLRVMAVLRSLNIDLCTVSGKASLAAANRHDMCNLEKPVEPVSIPNRERNDLIQASAVL